MNTPLPVMLRRARATYGTAQRAALTDAGYDDVPQNGLFVFGSLDPAGAPSPLGDLVAGLGMSKQSGGQLVDVMVLKGYVDRQPDPHDRRKLTVALTERGQDAAKVQLGVRDRIDRELADAIGPAGCDALRDSLAALIEIGANHAAQVLVGAKG